ncbi:SUMF1/EgtB/PvdO family nonheme iron enzyme [Candidatus Parabeggiatoa sp. HSG14]|uniref:SUMF1/EgtB/PvdO family nonheme iron enzyme n=1 Tax=Candidatus Parabeggiatoa sp. HSG14 TaxID=3055593 RepID=UPI0025A8D674|nr:SUMF1/EgtB/PvdO family nonheme iron enzyme [Thiotrichales bacterium HSG14]
MDFLSLTHIRLLILLMIGLMLAACDPQTGIIRDPGGITDDLTPYVQGQSLSTANMTHAAQSPHGAKILSSYSGSYALLIGQNRYTQGWSNLESIPGELQQVEQILKSQGFTVEKSSNLNSRQLEDRFERFIDKYGFDEDNRLLFFYSGHGYTRQDKGYIVPVDAANPNFNEKAFLRKAVGMNQVLTWARKIEAKHVLFLFDSCFSGTVFKAKDLPKISRQITEAAEEPVRQFITAGSANETVPAKSVFTPAFIDALRYGWGDLYKDGFITGQELGLYLKSKVPNHVDQTPQYGKIKDYELSRGDFVFVVGGSNQVVAQPVIPSAPVLSVPAAPVPIPKIDSDKDGITDDQDKCPRNTAAEISKGVYKSGSRKGCPIDSDNDRVADYRDNCPHNRSKEISQGVDSRGCPLDSDRDNVADYQDSCPSTSVGVTVKENGCPIPVPVVSVQPPSIVQPSFSDNAAGKVFRDRLKDGSKGPEMVWIPAGTFRMGDIQGGGRNNEQSVHKISVDGFAMGRYEVTFSEYDKFAEAIGREKPSDESWGRGRHPVINISWYDAVAYAEWLSQQTGQQYRLPTEAEWEYAARAGTETKYWWGNDIGSSNKANCYRNQCGDSFEHTAPVGSFVPNQFGLYDTVGNVWERTCSEYDSKYQGKEKSCLDNVNNNSRLILRGGSWSDIPSSVRSANRVKVGTIGYNKYIGFRLVRL